MKQIMMQIPAKQAICYPIFLDSGLLENVKTWLPEKFHDKHLVIITDDHVKALYGNHLMNVLHAHNMQPLLLAFPAGEIAKNNQTKQYLEEQMLQQHCDRETLILALGGGVVGDMAGFVAATYMRGIAYIQIPTTLLAMVDSSVGGKTGIDTPYGKNLIGAFCQPAGVVADIDCLKTLSQRHLINGLIEALKMFITHDAEKFHAVDQQLEKIMHKDTTVLQTVIRHAVKIKTTVVSADEIENNQRMILNFGHTIGHALEKVLDYTLLHGYAVALGILVEAKMAVLLGLLSSEDYQAIQSVLHKLEISGSELKKINIDAVIYATKLDKKSQDGNARYILLNKIGSVYASGDGIVHPVADAIVKQALIDVSEA